MTTVNLFVAQQGPQARQQLRDQIQEQVREQVEAAREAAREAREEARQAQEEARAAQEEAQAALAQDAPQPPGEPTILVRPPYGDFEAIPRGAMEISIAFFIMIAVIAVGLPLARAFARRLDRRALPQANPEQAAQLQRIEQAVESIAIEVERISEGQRYTAKLLTDRHPEPAVLPQRSKMP